MKMGKLQRCFLQICLSVILLFIPSFGFSQSQVDKNFAIEKTRNLLSEIVKKSYPELADEKIKVETFESEKNFFQSPFFDHAISYLSKNQLHNFCQSESFQQ